MGRLDLAAVMDAFAASVVDAGVVERSYAWPNPSVSPPAFVVGYPSSFTPGVTFERGHDRATVPAWLVLGNIEERTTREVVADYFDAFPSIVDALNAADAGGEFSCRVMLAEFGTWVPTPELTYLAIRFDVDVLS